MFRDEYSRRYVGRNIAGFRVYAQLFEHYQTNVTFRITLDSLAGFLPEAIPHHERLSDIRGCRIASGRYYQDRSWALDRHLDPDSRKVSRLKVRLFRGDHVVSRLELNKSCL